MKDVRIGDQTIRSKRDRTAVLCMSVQRQFATE